MGMPANTGRRLIAGAAHSLLAWSARQAYPPERVWIEALRGELEVVEAGLAQLLWQV